MYLHIFGSNKRGFTLHYTSTPDLSSEIKVQWFANKQAAKKEAKEAMKACGSLIAWNF